MRRSHLLVLTVVISLLSRSIVHAQSVFVFTGVAGTDLFTTSGNWTSPGGFNPPPPTDGSVGLKINPDIALLTLPAGTLDFTELTLDNNATYGSFLYLGSAGQTSVGFTTGVSRTVTSKYASLTFDPSIAVRIDADQTWTVGSATFLGSVGGNSKLTLAASTSSGTAAWTFYAANAFDGGLSIDHAYVNLHHPEALGGTGPFEFISVVLYPYENLTIQAPTTLRTSLTVNDLESKSHQIEFLDTVTLDGNVSLQNYGENNQPIRLSGGLAESTSGSKLTINSGDYLLDGPSTFTGGADVQDGKLIFRTAAAIPTTGDITSAENGYMGAAFSTNLQSAFVDRLSATDFEGTIGFDTPSVDSFMTEASNLDLSGVDSNYHGLGSSTYARISGTLSIGSVSDYRFGGGGGVLFVSSNLDISTAGLRLQSLDDPLRVVLQGTNTFGGNILLENGALVVDHPAGLPSGATVSSQGSLPTYFGATENASTLDLAALIGRLGTVGDELMVGLDSSDINEPRAITAPLDLSLGGTVNTPYFFGTSSALSVAATITPSATNGNLYLGAFGGTLSIDAPLTSSVNDLYLGQPDAIKTEGTVALNTANAHSGDTYLQSGNLVLGHADALSTGALVVEGASDGPAVTLRPSADLSLSNNIVLNQPLSIGRDDEDFDLALLGKIVTDRASYADTTLYFHGAGQLGLHGSGKNFRVDAYGSNDSAVSLDGDYSQLSINLHKGNLIVEPGVQTVSGLTTESTTTTTLAAGATLRIAGNFNNSESHPYAEIYGVVAGAGGLQLVGSYTTLTLTHANSYSGGTSVETGAIQVGDNLALGTGPLRIVSPDQYSLSLIPTLPDLNLANAIELSGGLLVRDDYYDSTNYALTLSGVISGAGLINVSTPLTLSGHNTFSGALLVADTTIDFEADDSAGLALLTLTNSNSNGDPTVASFHSAAPVLHGLYSEDANTAVALAAGSNLTLKTEDNESYFNGTLTGSGAKLTKMGHGSFTLDGSLSLDGGVHIAEGNVIFNSTSSLGTLGNTTTNAISVDSAGYAGLAAAEYGLTHFLAAFDPATTTGAIGLDTPAVVYTPTFNTTANYHTDAVSTEYTPVFNGAIDLSAFNANVRLGTSTIATLGSNAVITPAGDANADYRFGNGGGFLTVAAPLSGTRGVTGDSASLNPLLVLFTGANTFTGPVTATQTALIFGTDALPASAQLILGTGGYIGTASPSITVADYLARFDAATAQGIIGFDRLPTTSNASGSPRVLSSGLDLSGFTGSELPFFGTATDLILRGPIVLPSNTAQLRFASVQGGQLTVDSLISGANVSVQIGDPSNLATQENRVEQDTSTVTLTGANTYGGGTTLTNGRLAVTGDGTTSALGTGALTVAPHDYVATHGDLVPELAPAGSVAVLNNNIVLENSLTLHPGSDQRLILNGVISGTSVLLLSGSGTTELNGANTYAGGTTFNAGTLYLGNDLALGSGYLRMEAAYSNVIAQNGARTLNNSVKYGDNQYTFTSFTGDSLTLNGDVDLGVAYRFLNIESDLFINGDLLGGGYVALYGKGRLWLANANPFTGQIAPESGHLILNDINALAINDENTGQLHGGYFGLATPTADLQDKFLALFDPSYSDSTIGFDTLPGQATSVFGADIDLSAFSDYVAEVSLGTASSAELTGTITPAGDTYQFGGNSQGILTVASNLSNATVETYRSLYAETSDDQAFILRLTGQNTYSGTTSIRNSALVLASAQALGPDTNLDIGSGAYIGLEHPDLAFTSLVSALAASDSSGSLLLGYDSASTASPRTLTSPDLSAFTPSAPSIGLGTTTAAVIDGTITLPAGQNFYSFFGYGGGQLVVNSTLSGSGIAVEIGRGSVAATTTETSLGLPGVTLNSANTYDAGTRFYGGRLTLGNASALGTGALTVSSDTDNAAHILRFSADHFDNAIDLSSDLILESTVPSVTLNGVLSGSGRRLGVFDDFELTLTGANTLNASSFVITNGAIHFGSDNASVGSGNTLSFTGNGGAASFASAHPVLTGLTQQAGAAASLALSSGTTLELDLDTATKFDGTISGAGALQKSGDAKLTLTGVNTYAGGTIISGGLLHAANTNALGTGSVTLDGGLLSLAPGVEFSNAFAFGAGGGKLGGSGTFNGPVHLTANSGLSPGNSVGAMTFTSDLTWSGGAFFDLEVEDAVGTRGVGYDTVYVGGSLIFTATQADPFTVNLLTIDTGSGTTLAFDNTLTYKWTLASANAITGFDADAFKFTLTGFDTDVGTWGNFFASSNGTELFINFTPVPEPSTYVLFGVGLLVIGGQAWRRRRRG